MAAGAKVVIDLIVNSSKAAGDIDQTARKFSSLGGGLREAAAPAAAVGAALLGIGAVAAKAASDTQQAMGGLDAVFGKNSQVMKDWAAQAATSVGLSESQYAEMAAVIGAQLKNLGVPMDQVAGQTNDLVKIGADLAATYGGTTSEAVQALGAALRGEADPAERYGLALSQTAVKAKMAAEGTDKLTGAAAQQAKTTALLGLVTEQAGGALGQFARESDSAAGSAQIAQAQWQNTLSTLGTALLPIVSAAAGKLSELAGFVTANSKAFQVFAVVAASLAAAILLANAAMTVYATVTAVAAVVTELASKAALGTRVQLIALAAAERAAAIGAKIMAAGQWLLNAALTANPIGIVILLLVALVVAIVIAYNKSETFRAIVQAVGAALVVAFHAVVAAVKVAVAWIVMAWGKIVTAFQVAWAAIVAVASAIVAWFVNAWNLISAGAQIAWNLIVSVVTTVVSRIVALAQVMLRPYVLAFQLIAQVARIAFQLIRLAIQITLAGAIITANRIRAVFIAAWNAIKSAASAAWSAVRSAVQAIASPIIAVANRIKSAFTAAWNAIKSAARTAASLIRSAFTAIAAPIIAVVNRIKSAFSSALNAIKSAAKSAASAIKSAFSAVAAPIISVANRIKSAFTSALNAIKSAARSAGSAVSSAFSGVRGVINGIIGAVERLISALRRIKVPSIKLPSLGGASRSAPASNRAAFMPASGLSLRGPGDSALAAGYLGMGPKSGGSPTIIQVTVNGALDPDAVARQIERVLSGAQRRRSGVTMSQRASGTAAPV